MAKEYTSEERKKYARMKITEKAYDKRTVAEKGGGPALLAHLQNAYRREHPQNSPSMGKYVDAKEGESFESAYIRYLDPAGAKFEEAGDSVAAMQSRVAQAERLIGYNKGFPGENVNYYLAGLLYQSAGELEKAKSAIDYALKAPNRGSNQFDIIFREGAITKSNDLEKKLQTKSDRINRRRTLTSAGIAAVALLGATFILSTNITGNAISNLNQTTSNWIGACLFCVGLVAGFIWIKKR